MALHFSITVYHETSTCRIGDVVDPRLKVMGVKNLRVADASVMPNVDQRQHQRAVHHDRREGGGDDRAERGVKLRKFVGERVSA